MNAAAMKQLDDRSLVAESLTGNREAFGQIVLDAIGGRLSLGKPFAACGRNITRVPNQKRVEAICDTLRSFCGDVKTENADPEIVDLLRTPTPERQWLAASLEKTIRLQLNPSPAMGAVSSLTGPEWIKS